MTVHSFHIFDRRGKTLFTKRYVPKKNNNNNNNKDEDANKNDDEAEEERLSEQRKLVFGMLYSLRELSSSLSPVDGPGDLQFMKTGASNVYNYETVSGLRFVLYTTNNDITSRPTTNTNSTNPTTGSSATTTPQSSSHGKPTTNPTLVGGPTSTGLINSATALTNQSGMNNMNDSNSSSSIHGNTTTGTTNPTQTANIRSSLKYIYEHIWVAYVIRSPMYQPNCNNKDNDNAIKSTNFEVTLDNYLKGMTWYR
jgi:hypothetical protein